MARITHPPWTRCAKLSGSAPTPAQGVLAGPGTPRDPKSHLFVTNRVAIQPFCTSEAGFDAKFRRGSRQIGPTPSNSTFFWTIFDPKNAQNRIFCEGFEKIREIPPAGLKCPPRAPQGVFFPTQVARDCGVPRRGLFFRPKTRFWAFVVQKWSKKS